MVDLINIEASFPSDAGENPQFQVSFEQGGVGIAIPRLPLPTVREKGIDYRTRFLKMVDFYVYPIAVIKSLAQSGVDAPTPPSIKIVLEKPKADPVPGPLDVELEQPLSPVSIDSEDGDQNYGFGYQSWYDLGNRAKPPEFAEEQLAFGESNLDTFSSPKTDTAEWVKEAQFEEDDRETVRDGIDEAPKDGIFRHPTFMNFKQFVCSHSVCPRIC